MADLYLPISILAGMALIAVALASGLPKSNPDAWKSEALRRGEEAARAWSNYHAVKRYLRESNLELAKLGRRIHAQRRVIRAMREAKEARTDA